jgi:hypothetical protein
MGLGGFRLGSSDTSMPGIYIEYGSGRFMSGLEFVGGLPLAPYVGKRTVHGPEPQVLGPGHAYPDPLGVGLDLERIQIRGTPIGVIFSGQTGCPWVDHLYGQLSPQCVDRIQAPGSRRELLEDRVESVQSEPLQRPRGGHYANRQTLLANTDGPIAAWDLFVLVAPSGPVASLETVPS